ncbi:MAG: efflux RND transporter periplasmic adaptor subunit, partial [Pseudomonadales bacterium]
GDTVEVGVLLALIDDKPYRDTFAAAEAQVQEAKAQLDRLRAGSRPQEIQQFRARVREASAALRNATQDLDRQQELMAEGVGSQRALDAAIARQDQMAAQVASSEEALALAEEGAHTADIAAAEAALAAANAQLAQHRTQLDDTRLHAPNAGVILTRAREPGAIVAVAEPVYTLSLTESVYVRAYVAEPELGLVAPGRIVAVTTDGSERRYRGQVGFVSPRAEFTPRTVETPELRTDLVYRLRIVVTDPDQGLRQGMPVTVELASEND